MAGSRRRLLPALTLAATAGVLYGLGPTAPAAPAYASRPPLAHTGGFGEPTCHTCHFGAPVDSGPGGLRIDLPAPKGEDRPAGRLRIRVTLEHPGLARGGFELSVRHLRGERAGARAGNLLPVDGRVEVRRDPSSGVEYATHSPTGTAPTRDDTSIWEIAWDPPTGDTGPAIVHVAANAADYDDSEFGDLIYTAELPVEPTEVADRIADF